MSPPSPALQLAGAGLSFGERRLWGSLELSVSRGEFLAVLGPNGAGKSTLLRVLLGLQPLSEGTVAVLGREPRRGNPAIGYVSQQRSFDRDLPLRARDLVRLGFDGHRFGLPLPSPRARARVAQALAEVGAAEYADARVGQLSGGEQQRLQIAQALLADPQLLLCDEPLLSLDLRHQQEVAGLIEHRRRSENTAVVFVTHEINPILEMVDRILFLVGGSWALGRPDEVLNGETLSELYHSQVDVLRVRDRIIVVGAPQGAPDPGNAVHSDFTEPLPSYQP